MQVQDVSELPWQARAGCSMKELGPGLTLWLVKEPACLPLEADGHMLIVLNGRGRVLLHRREVLASPGVVLTLRGSEQVNVVPATDEPLILLRHSGHARETADIVADSFHPDPNGNSLGDQTPPQAAHGPDAASDIPRDGSADGGADSEAQVARQPSPTDVEVTAPSKGGPTGPPIPSESNPAQPPQMPPPVASVAAEDLGGTAGTEARTPTPSQQSDPAPRQPPDLASWLRARRQHSLQASSASVPAVPAPDPDLPPADAPPSDLASWLRARRPNASPSRSGSDSPGAERPQP